VDMMFPHARNITFLTPLTGPPPPAKEYSAKRRPDGLTSIATALPPLIQMDPQPPFKDLVRRITPDKPLPQPPTMSLAKPSSRLPQSSAVAELAPRQYGPTNPLPGSLVSQPEKIDVFRPASLPAISRIDEESRAIVSFEDKDLQSHRTDSKEATTNNALTPVKFVDYLKLPPSCYIMLPNVKEYKSGKDQTRKASADFIENQAKVFISKLLPTAGPSFQNSPPKIPNSITDATL
jgi:hypothetical protein